MLRDLIKLAVFKIKICFCNVFTSFVLLYLGNKNVFRKGKLESAGLSVSAVFSWECPTLEPQLSTGETQE